MSTLSKSHRELIADLKTFIKSRSHKQGGLTHHHYVLYAALRGRDIRKTSHLFTMKDFEFIRLSLINAQYQNH